jgi:hypothetical protein
LILAILALSAGIAHADDTERLVLPKKRGLIQAFLEISLSDGAVGKPVSVAPDIWYGVTDKITVGLIHSTRAAAGFLGATDDGLCLTGRSNGCEGFYSTAGLDARFHLKDGALSLAAQGGLFAIDLNPVQLKLKVGALARWHKGKMAVDVAPAMFFGLTERETTGDDGQPQTNKELFTLPVTFLYSVAKKVAVAAQTGVLLPFEATGDTWSLPFSLGAQLAATDAIFVEAAFTLIRLAGGSDAGAFDGRTFTLGGGYAF